MRELNNTDFAEVVATNDTVFVDLWAEWCPPCRAVAPILDELEAEFPEVTFAKLDVDSYPEIAREFNVRSIPTFLLFQDGQVELVRSGAMGKDELIKDFFSE